MGDREIPYQILAKVRLYGYYYQAQLKKTNQEILFGMERRYAPFFIIIICSVPAPDLLRRPQPNGLIYA
jgi:hypothetical protein